VVIVGSGLAGLSSAESLAAAGVGVTVVTAARLGRDGATHRVHALAPWILLTAPWVKGDSPAAFAADIDARAGGIRRVELAEILAEAAHPAAVELCEALDLEVMDGGAPVLLPGDTYPRGRRCLPRNRAVMLAPLIERCRAAGVEFVEQTVVSGLEVVDRRVAGVVGVDRSRGRAVTLPADAVVVAAGGSGAVFPLSTSPRWCRGTALTLGAAAGALLHRPGLLQSLPVTATPPLYFPTTAALLRGRILIDGEPLPPPSGLDEATRAIAQALRSGRAVTLECSGDGTEILPERVRGSSTFRLTGQVPLTVATHHGIGGLAIDAHGRTSLTGLYACGEAAGGVQGGRRTMGTGLLEARVFGTRAGRAVEHDLPKLGPAPGVPPGPPDLGELPADPEGLERRLDDLLRPLTALRPEADVSAALRELEAWPATRCDDRVEKAVLAGLRLGAARVILQDSLAGAGSRNRGSDRNSAEEAV